MPRLDDGRVLAEAQARLEANGRSRRQRPPVCAPRRVAPQSPDTRADAGRTLSVDDARRVARIRQHRRRPCAGSGAPTCRSARSLSSTACQVRGSPRWCSTSSRGFRWRRHMPDGSPGLDTPSVRLDPAAMKTTPRTRSGRASRRLGADLAVASVVIAGVSYNGDPELLPPSLPKDIAAIDPHSSHGRTFGSLDIDPLIGCQSSRTLTSHRDQDVRRPLARLARMAAERNVCVVARPPRSQGTRRQRHLRRRRLRRHQRPSPRRPHRRATSRRSSVGRLSGREVESRRRSRRPAFRKVPRDGRTERSRRDCPHVAP